MNKKPAQTEMTKKNFNDAFWKLYTKKSIDKITVKNICDLAGYNRSTFYQYFTDVYDLLHQLENRILDEVNEFLIHFVDDSKHQSSQELMMSIFGILSKYNQSTAVLLGPHGDTEFTHKIIENLKSVWIKYYFQTDQYTLDEVDLLMEYHLSGLLAMYQKWFFNQSGVSDQRFLQMAMEIIPNTGIFDTISEDLKKK